MPRRRRFRDRRFYPLRWLLNLVVLLAGAWGVGFLAFMVVVWAESPPNPIPHADGIVALTGGDGRVSAALALLAERAAPALLISGAGRGTYLGDFTADDALAATRYASEITVGHAALTTEGNAVETAAWANARHMRALIIVTADYHMPRASLEIQRCLPEVRLIEVPVRPPAISHLFGLPTLRLLAVEYSKYLVVRSGLFDDAGSGGSAAEAGSGSAAGQ
jgi:uncharacterized SAM-binding protein YcdF (DUF218 family)